MANKPVFSLRESAAISMDFSKKIPSNLNALPGLTGTIIEKIRQLPLDEAQVQDIRLSLQEALVNSAKHGNKLNPDLYVEVSVEGKDDSLIITVADQGEGFDFEGIPDPRKPDNLNKLSGRGIFLIRKRMDMVEFLDHGRRIKMVKFFRKGVKK